VIKDIIANLSVTKNGSAVGNYAASVAAALQAHLTGVAFVYDPIVPISDGGYIPAEVIDTQPLRTKPLRDQEFQRCDEQGRNFRRTAEVECEPYRGR
jgi:hypothetical protein